MPHDNENASSWQRHPRRKLKPELDKGLVAIRLANTCSFTEPFFSIDVNVKRKIMKVSQPMGELMDGKIATERTDEIDNVVLANAGGVWTFNYVPEGGTKIAVLSIDTHKKGSDGMSDKVWDAEGTTPVLGGKSSANSGVGGCNFLR